MHDSLIDSFERRMDTLRISVTDRCNFRCVYCDPAKNYRPVAREALLSFEEITRVVAAVVPLGIRRVRLTGGEPLLRQGLPDLVRRLKEVKGLEKIALTTNGSMLAAAALALKRAGLSSVNVSLDTLNARKFEAITLMPLLKRVLGGIETALACGLPVKLNVVALQGTPLEEVLDLVRFAIQIKSEVRFIEFMPLCGPSWSPERMLPIPNLKAWIEEHFELVALPRGNEPASSFQIAGTEGRVGFIASLSEPFCANCSRLRLSATGKIRPCLFSPLEFDLMKLLRGGAKTEEIRNLFRWATWNKPAGHPYRAERVKAGTAANEREDLMRSIGG